jgi:hypothetical protein
MVLRSCRFLPWIAFFALVAPFPAGADPITVTFTAFPSADDAINTGPSTGTFTFDRNLIPLGGGRINNQTGLGATNIRFVWGHTVWTTANADIGELEFSPSGGLLFWLMGGKTNHLFGMAGGIASLVVDDFLASASAGGNGMILYTNAGYADGLVGLVESDSIVPEPSTMLLLATGIGVVGRVARRRRDNKETVQ